MTSRILILVACAILAASCSRGEPEPRVSPAPRAAVDAGVTAAPLPAQPRRLQSEHYTLTDFSATVTAVHEEATVPATPAPATAAPPAAREQAP